MYANLTTNELLNNVAGFKRHKSLLNAIGIQYIKVMRHRLKTLNIKEQNI